MKHYLVLIGDIARSREMNPAAREKLQVRLKALFGEIGDSGGSLVSPYTITLGDEFQAVYRSADHFFRHIWFLMSSLYPVEVRWSAAVDGISTSINREQAIGMDGPAFHRARDGMEILKRENLLFHISTDDAAFDGMVNNALRIITPQVRSWKLNRIKILHTLYEGQEVKETARSLGISEVAVYKNINAGSLSAIKGFTDGLSLMINGKTG